MVPTNGKIATEPGFGAENPTFTCGPSWFGEPHTRVGILCGPCPALGDDMLLCVDIDGAEWDTVPVLRAFVDGLPSTLESHDGHHIFLRVAPDAAALLGQWPDVFRTKAATGCAIDLKWSGGYACEDWDWAPGTDVSALAAAIAPLPAASLEAILATRTTPPTPSPMIPPLEGDRGDEFLRANGFNPAEVREDAARWLLTQAPLPTEGTGGATMMVVFGALMVGFGLDDVAALELAIDVYAPRAWPGEDPDEDGFIHKIDQIDANGSERFDHAPLALAVTARETRRGAELTRYVEFPSIVLGTAAPSPVVALSSAREDEERLLTWNARLQRNFKNEIRNTVFNTLLTLDMHPFWHGVFGYDDFTHDVVFLRAPTIPQLSAVRAGDVFNEDQHPVLIRAWFGHNAHEPSPAEMISAVHAAARSNQFHAVRTYLDARRGTWDGVDRNLVDYLGADPTPYHRAVCAKWLRSAVARAMVPGAKADTMLILEGKQGWRKSTAIRCLCPDVRWFYEAASRDMGSKDFMQDMRGKWLCEIPEVDQLIRSRDESELKALLTRTSDNYRPSYARRATDFPRQLVFAGTTNHDDYLRDETGNRRYWAVQCCQVGPIRDGAICDDRHQIWAQALAEYESGQQWWLTPEEDALARDEQANRIESDPWAEVLDGWLTDRGDEPFSTVQLLAGLPGAKTGAELEQRDMNRAGKLLRELGYEQFRSWANGRRLRLWKKFP